MMPASRWANSIDRQNVDGKKVHGEKVEGQKVHDKRSMDKFYQTLTRVRIILCSGSRNRRLLSTGCVGGRGVCVCVCVCVCVVNVCAVRQRLSWNKGRTDFGSNQKPLHSNMCVQMGGRASPSLPVWTQCLGFGAVGVPLSASASLIFSVSIYSV